MLGRTVIIFQHLCKKPYLEQIKELGTIINIVNKSSRFVIHNSEQFHKKIMNYNILICSILKYDSIARRSHHAVHHSG